jgi:hypothetical protein
VKSATAPAEFTLAPDLQPVLNVLQADASIKMEFTPNAAHPNTISFYKIVSLSGAINDPLTGEQVLPEDSRYTTLIRDSLARSASISFGDDSTPSSAQTQTLQLAEGFWAPFVTSVIDDRQVHYTPFSSEIDQLQHFRVGDAGRLQYEDLPGPSSDYDFNDIKMQILL